MFTVKNATVVSLVNLCVWITYNLHWIFTMERVDGRRVATCDIVNASEFFKQNYRMINTIVSIFVPVSFNGRMQFSYCNSPVLQKIKISVHRGVHERRHVKCGETSNDYAAIGNMRFYLIETTNFNLSVHRRQRNQKRTNCYSSCG